MNLDLYRKRQVAYGGSSSIDKLDYRNKQLFNRALQESFNAEEVVLNNKDWRALILEDKLTLELDQKWIGMPLESNLKPGDVIHVKRNDIRWIMVQTDLSERSFCRCVGKRCVAEITWRDEDDNVHSSWAALRGPTETSIKTEARKHILFDQGNEKVALWLPDTPETKSLRRYKHIMVKGETWEIASVDYLTTPGILELNLVEAQDNRDLDNTSLGIARDNKFTFTNVFDKDLDFQLNTYISLEPYLTKDGVDITEEKESEFVFTCYPDTYTYDEVHLGVSFSELGNYHITIGYPNMKMVKEYDIEIKQYETEIESYYLIKGNSIIRPLVNSLESYDIDYFVNGVQTPITPGKWVFDKNFATAKSQSAYHIDLDFTGEIGTMTLQYVVDNKVLAEKEITVYSVFG
ncbi:MAG: hypothetical protein J6A25_10970 [Lachnospiraceae bacterium]|nr:hypothetical protein [Lachnospiraceae bacterium]